MLQVRRSWSCNDLKQFCEQNTYILIFFSFNDWFYCYYISAFAHMTSRGMRNCRDFPCVNVPRYSLVSGTLFLSTSRWCLWGIEAAAGFSFPALLFKSFLTSDFIPVRQISAFQFKSFKIFNYFFYYKISCIFLIYDNFLTETNLISILSERNF